MSSGGDSGGSTENYATVPIPEIETKPREDREYQERRSEL